MTTRKKACIIKIKKVVIKMFIIEDFFITFIFGIIGLLLIVFGIYLKKVNSNFKKNGIDTEFEVINVKVEPKYDPENNKIGEFYLTTFKFKSNDKVIKEEIQTRQKFKVGTTIIGKYLPNASLNKISVANEGFSIPEIIPISLIYLGLILLLILLSILLNISIKIVLPVIIIVIISFFIIKKYLNRNTQQQK